MFRKSSADSTTIRKFFSKGFSSGIMPNLTTFWFYLPFEMRLYNHFIILNTKPTI